MLKRTLVIAAAAGLFTTAAQADSWKRYGSAEFSTRVDRQVESARFRGHVDRIRLTARGSGVICRRVVAEFGNNQRREIFSGRIRRGRSRVIDLPGKERRVDRLMLVCRATERGRDHARVLIAARVDDRRRGRRRNRIGWERLGAVVLHDRLEREVESVRGGTMDRLRFTPRHSSIVCRRIVAVFGNGKRQEVFSGRIRRNERQVVDLPGDERRVKRLIFRCRATHRGNDRARLLIDGRMERRRRGRRRATVCCRKLFFEWTTSARQCREVNGRRLAPRYCR